MQIYGITEVRNEADIIDTTVSYHLSIGMDRILVIDNGSTDGTTDVLKKFARDPRVSIRSIETSRRSQDVHLTFLARQAWQEGADWVLPFDADEFWYSPEGNVRDVLEKSRHAGLKVPRVNFVPDRAQEACNTDAVAQMTYRAIPRSPHARMNKELVESRRIAWIEILPPPKVAIRATEHIEVKPGNHEASGFNGPVELCAGLQILHVPLRGKWKLFAKAENGKRIAQTYPESNIGWHSRRFARLEEEGELDREWRANSQWGGCLDVFGRERAVPFDETLVKLIAPWSSCKP